LRCGPPNQNASFGYQKARPLATAFSAVFGIGVVLTLAYGTLRDWNRPHEASAAVMFAAGLLGILINSLNIYILKKGPDEPDISVLRSDNIADVGMGAAIIAGAILIPTTGIVLDPFIALAIAGYVVWAWGKALVRSMAVILDFVPDGIRTELVARELLKVSGVHEINDLHIWSAGGQPTLSCHVVVDANTVEARAAIRNQMGSMLEQRFNVRHTTFEFESSFFPYDALKIPLDRSGLH
jgi:cobalt-zinc-cadmium efflux system protein